MCVSCCSSSRIRLTLLRFTAMFDNNAVELERAEEQVEDLKAQLDDAMGAEDMLEQLTERNLTLSEVRSSLPAATAH